MDHTAIQSCWFLPHTPNRTIIAEQKLAAVESLAPAETACDVSGISQLYFETSPSVL